MNSVTSNDFTDIYVNSALYVFNTQAVTPDINTYLRYVPAFTQEKKKTDPLDHRLSSQRGGDGGGGGGDA